MSDISEPVSSEPSAIETTGSFPPQFSMADTERLETLLTWRRDVRHFRADPIAPHLVERLMRAMELAPSVGNSRPWRVLQVDSPALRSAIRGEFAQCNAAGADRYTGSRRDSYLALKLAGIDIAPLQLAVFTETDPVSGHGLGRQTMASTLEQSTIMGIHSLWLVARTLGLGVGMLSILRPAQVQNILSTPDGWKFTAWLCIGYPAFEDNTPLLHRVGWQRNEPTTWQIR